mgnify:CR=1 FL=1
MAIPRFNFGSGSSGLYNPNQILVPTTLTSADKTQLLDYDKKIADYKTQVDAYNKAVEEHNKSGQGTFSQKEPTDPGITQKEIDTFGAESAARAQQLQTARQNALNILQNPEGFSSYYGIGSLGFEEGGAVSEGIASLRPSKTTMGLAPYGIRNSGEGAKGLGYFGETTSPSGQAVTEYSLYDEDIGEYPSIVPTLTSEELQDTIRRSSQGQSPSMEVIMKARMYAKDRLSEGKSPFAGPTELRFPVPSQTDDNMLQRIDQYLKKR